MAADGSKSPEAGAPEIEITSAMIEAGAEVISAFSGGEICTLGSPSGRVLAEEVYLAMRTVLERETREIGHRNSEPELLRLGRKA